MEAARWIYNLGGEIASHNQPTKKHNPPIGVIAPSRVMPVKVMA